ncbi:unnamed protein product [Auanema sp. JU1783]|nr:unnamed protein product [Auanema sp. JU1783]
MSSVGYFILLSIALCVWISHCHLHIPFDSNCTSFSYDDCPLDVGCEKVLRLHGRREIFRRCQFLSKASPSTTRFNRPHWRARYWLSDPRRYN